MGVIVALEVAYAAGIAFSPTPIIVLILILLGGIADRRTRRSAPAFLIGWIVGLIILGAVCYALARAGIFLADLASDSARPIIPLLIGLALLYYAQRDWRRGPRKKREQAEMPRWLRSMDKVISKTSGVMTPERSLVLAVVMSALSPKNIMLVLALCLAVFQSGLSDNQQMLLLVLFVLLSSLTIGVPVFYVMMKGEGASHTLMLWKTWIMENTNRMADLFVAFLGVLMVTRSLVEIASMTGNFV